MYIRSTYKVVVKHAVKFPRGAPWSSEKSFQLECFSALAGSESFAGKLEIFARAPIAIIFSLLP